MQPSRRTLCAVVGHASRAAERGRACCARHTAPQRQRCVRQERRNRVRRGGKGRGGTSTGERHNGGNEQPFSIGDTTFSGEVAAMIIPVLVGGKQLYNCTPSVAYSNGGGVCSTGGCAFPCAAAKSADGRMLDIVVVNDGSNSAAPLQRAATFNVGAPVASPSYVVVSEVSNISSAILIAKRPGIVVLVDRSCGGGSDASATRRPQAAERCSAASTRRPLRRDRERRAAGADTQWRRRSKAVRVNTRCSRRSRRSERLASRPCLRRPRELPPARRMTAASDGRAP